MIGVAVRRHDHRQAARALASQERDHNALPGVASGKPRAAVDHDPAAGRGAECGSVALSDVQKMYCQTSTVVEVEGVENGR